MNVSTHFSSEFYRDDLRVFVTCTPAGCGVDVAQPVKNRCGGYHLELLLQLTDENGWPQGSVRMLYEAEIPMSMGSGSHWSRGYHRLPFRMTEELLSRCHIRLKCNTVSSPGE